MENQPIYKTSSEANRDELKKALLIDIEAAKSEIEAARCNFNQVYKPDDVDIFIYKLRSASSRYEKLIKQLKDLV